MVGLHTTKTYKVEYGSNVVGGLEMCHFLNYLRGLMGEGKDVYIDENETQVEIAFSVVDELRSHEKYGAIAEKIWNESDHSNSEAHLDIW